MKLKKNIFRIIATLILVLSIYGLGRLYFYLTAGFTLSNISSDFTYQPEWEVRPLTGGENDLLNSALGQTYHYLGKGCQSYVFVSRDGEYVIKFFKYQRFRMQPWLTFFPPLPAIVKYREEKKEKKWFKLDGFIKSWKVAFEYLKDETGLIFIHLNKTKSLNKNLIIFDKLGIEHQIDLDQMEFCIQHRAEMLCDVLLRYKQENDLKSAQVLIDRLLALIVSEYHRGLADNDHALMQNTGVVQGNPIHIDVGQFVINENVKEPTFYHQELFTKNYKFKLWLFQHYPELGTYLDNKLQDIIGERYSEMEPIWRNKK
jgi:hypothetical protein